MNKNVLISAVFLFLISISILFYKIEIMEGITILLKSNYLRYACLIFIFISIVCNTYYVPESTLENVPMFKSNSYRFFEGVLNFATYSAVASTAISLLKGLYLQTVNNELYFLKFSDYDIYIMFAVSGLLLWFAF